MLLISSGYRKNGLAYFPVTDVQGNIRGYANTSGVQSAYAYYPYGTLIDLAHSNAEDSRRWQAKEFDSDLNKYYFGARFYDPLFGLWLAPDPAGQFADPYTYGGDPLNYIDPNGESVTAAIAIGAAVGAAIGGIVSAVNCSGANEVGCGRAVAGGTVVGALAGAASGGVGSAVSGLATGAAGVLMESGSAAAFAGGAVGGAAGSAAGYTSSYFLNNTLGNRSEWSWLGWNGFLAQVGIGTVLGGTLSKIRFQTDVNYNRPMPAGYTIHSNDPVKSLKGIRPLTTRERSMIQTFPEDFQFLGNKTDQEQMIGNAVPVNLGSFVARAILDSIGQCVRDISAQHRRKPQPELALR